MLGRGHQVQAEADDEKQTQGGVRCDGKYLRLEKVHKAEAFIVDEQ